MAVPGVGVIGGLDTWEHVFCMLHDVIKDLQRPCAVNVLSINMPFDPGS